MSEMCIRDRCLRDLPDAHLLRLAHPLRAQIAMRNEGKIVVQLFHPLCVGGIDRIGVTVTGALQGQQSLDFGIPKQHLKACTNFMNAVVNGLQLGGFVDHMVWRGDFSAVMQPRANPKFMPFVVRIEAEIRQ